MRLVSDETYLAHHGIKGMRWGIRRFQNEDGSLTPAGEKRYGGEKGAERLRKDNARASYKKTQRSITKREIDVDDKYDKKRLKNTYGLDSGSAGDRVKNHIKNEYARSKAKNKLDQERLDAHRRYRQELGKKKIDTVFMRMEQQRIDEISNQTIEEFTRDYVRQAISNAASMATRHDRDDEW